MFIGTEPKVMWLHRLRRYLRQRKSWASQWYGCGPSMTGTPGTHCSHAWGTSTSACSGAALRCLHEEVWWCLSALVRLDNAATGNKFECQGSTITASRDGLDWVVNEAREFGIRIIMVLTDSQGDYGGMAQYVRWAGPLTETVRDFYASKRIRVSLPDTCPLAPYQLSMCSCAAGHRSSSLLQLVHVCDESDYPKNCPSQKAFKEYVGAVILHKNTATGVYYRDDPTILGWEIANAPVCPGDDTGDLLQVQLSRSLGLEELVAHAEAHGGGFAVTTDGRGSCLHSHHLHAQNWIEDLSGHVKSLDQNHLVLLGHSGVFGASTPDKCAAALPICLQPNLQHRAQVHMRQHSIVHP
jgi:hypothetical protein